MPVTASLCFRSASSAAARRGSGGFTLIELLVVLVIIALVTGIASPFLVRSATTPSIDGLAREIATGLRKTRAMAVLTGKPAVLIVDVENRLIRSEAAEPIVDLPEEFEIELIAAQSEQIDSGAGGIRFFGDGSSTGGSIVVVHARSSVEIAVVWLNGRVRIR